jgi:hypothetical protein
VVPERTEENWQSQGSCGYIHPPLSMQSLQVTIDQCPRVVVVCGSGRILNKVCKDIMQFFQLLLDALSNQGQWNPAAIESQLILMSSMIKEYHACFDGIWFSRFVRMGQGGPLEMITTHEVCAVSNRGRDSNCLTWLLTFNSCHCLFQASMDALVHVVDHTSKHFEADCLGWRDVISSAHNLHTCHDLERFAAMCNNGHESVEGEYYLYKNWQSSFLGRPTYIRIRNGVEGHEKVEGREDKGSDNESWGGSIKSTCGCNYFLMYHQWIAYFKWLQFHPEEAARYHQFGVCVYASFLHCLVLING